MAFDVADFGEFLAILRVHPEWQSELRRVLLDDELAELRRSMEASFAGQSARLDRIEALFERQAEQIQVLTTRLVQLTERLDRLTARFDQFVDRTEQRFNRIDDDLGGIKGQLNEIWYRDRASGIFGQVIRRVRVISFADLDEVHIARKSGVITSEEWKDLSSLDLLVQGSDSNGAMLAIAVEVAFTVDEGDVSRAARRADVIARAGVPCLAAVGGRQVPDGLLLAARAAGVAVLREGDILYWPDAA